MMKEVLASTVDCTYCWRRNRTAMNAKTNRNGVDEIGAKAIKMTASKHRNPQGSYVDTVLGYGLSRDVARIMKKACKSAGAEFFHAKCLTDILAVPHFLLVCDFSALDEEQLKLQYAHMIEVADVDFSWLLLGTPAVKPPKSLLAASVRPPESIDEQSLKVILLRRRTSLGRRMEKTRSYDRKLFRLLSSLKKLRTQGLVKTADLCKEFGVTSRTIVRDMKMLQAIHEMIEYDKSAKAFRYVGDDPWLGER
jgi:hypothetical protein